MSGAECFTQRKKYYISYSSFEDIPKEELPKLQKSYNKFIRANDLDYKPLIYNGKTNKRVYVPNLSFESR